MNESRAMQDALTRECYVANLRTTIRTMRLRTNLVIVDETKSLIHIKS